MDESCKGTGSPNPATQQAGDRAARSGLWLLLPMAIMLSMGSGCSAWRGLTIWQNETFEEVAVNWRNHVWARQAWREHQSQFSNQPHCDAFGEGFTAGYCGICDGGTGCCPPTAPQEYWGWQYQTPEGQAKTAAWFAGYPYGVRAAEQDGVGHMNQIQTSALIDAQYSPQRKLGDQTAAGASTRQSQPATAHVPRDEMQR